MNTMENHALAGGGETSPRHFSGKLKLSLFLDQ